MATIVGGIATSHTPTIAFAKDANKQQDPVWKPIFEGYEPVQEWFREKQPDVLVYIYNDHMTAFFDHYSHFALGVGEEFGPADEGGGPRPLPSIKGHPALAKHIATALVADEFDLSMFQAKGLDHGVFSPLSAMMPHEHEWPTAIVPFLHGGVVMEYRWLTDKQFLDAVAVAMLTPGPVVITVAFIGYLVAGLSGGITAAIGVFLPTYLFVVVPYPWFDRFSDNPQVKAFVSGVTAAAAGAIAGACVVLGRRAIVDPSTALLALGTFGLLWRFKTPEPVLIAAAGAIGLLVFWLRGAP